MMYDVSDLTHNQTKVRLHSARNQGIMGRMTRTQVSFDEVQYRFLKREADERGMSLAAYLRGLVDREMAGRGSSESDIMALAGMFEGEDLMSEEIDEILAEEGLRGSPLYREWTRGDSARKEDPDGGVQRS